MLRIPMNAFPLRFTLAAMAAVVALASLIYWGNGLDQLVEDLNSIFFMRP